MESGNYTFEVKKSENDEIGILARAFVFMSKKVHEQILTLEHSSRTDPLTNIKNRIALDEALIQVKYNFERYDMDASVIMIDLDNFKTINDEYGHLTGDKTLIQLSRLLVRLTRKSDIVGRWGGEEFLIICPNTSLESGKILAESIRKKIESHEFESIKRLTSSFGVSAFQKEVSIEKLIDSADKALYQAKKMGRNHVCWQ